MNAKVKVYLITNIINGKTYVGITKRDLKIRWEKHVEASTKCIKDTQHLKADIKQYGKKNFKIELIEEVPEKDKFKKERYWIESLGPDYNTLTNSGHDDDEILDIIEEWKKGESITNLAFKHSISFCLLSKRIKALGYEIKSNHIHHKFILSEHPEVLEMFNKGVSIKKISDKIGKDRGIVSKRLREAGHDTNKNITNEERLQTAVSLYEAGNSIRSIVRKMNICHTRVSNRLKELGYDTVGKFGPKPELHALAISKYEQGYSLKSICSELNLDRKSLSKKLRALGHDTANQKRATDSQNGVIKRLYKESSQIIP